MARKSSQYFGITAKERLIAAQDLENKDWHYINRISTISYWDTTWIEKKYI